MNENEVVIRSYRRITHMEHRLYRGFSIFGYELKWPGGLPWRGFKYFMASLIVMLIVGRLPLVGLLPDPILYVVIPGGVAWFSMQYADRTDSLAPHAWVWLYLKDRLARETSDSTRWAKRLPVRWDATGLALHRAQIHGPATVRFNVPVGLNDRWNGWWAEGDAEGAGPRTVEIPAGRTLKVRP